MRTGLVAFVLALVLVPGAAAASGPPVSGQADAGLVAAERLGCQFVFYTVTVWVDGVPEVRTGDDRLEFQIDRIDRDAHTARLITSTAAAPVSAFLTDAGLTIIEQTPIGNFMVTTVFAAGGFDGALPAVHSRHFGDLSAPPSPSQYFGSCRVLS